jgi:N-formylmaleamate deformylase
MPSTGLKVHYKVIGDKPGKDLIDIVFIPGWTNPLEIYSKQFDFFRGKTRCIYIDVPGQGLSDAPEGIQYTMGLMADAIYDVVKKEGVKKFVGVGFSMGPVPLGQFELKHPGMMTKLVNLDGGFTPWPPENDPARDGFIVYLEGFRDAMLNWTREDKIGLGSVLVPPTAPDDLKEFVTYFYDFPNWLMANIWWNVNREDVNQPIGWKLPILSIYSEEPTDMDYEQLYFPDSDIHVMKGSGHCVQWEKHEIVNQLIWKFINERHWKVKPWHTMVPFRPDHRRPPFNPWHKYGH